MICGRLAGEEERNREIMANLEEFRNKKSHGELVYSMMGEFNKWEPSVISLPCEQNSTFLNISCGSIQKFVENGKPLFASS